MKTNPELFFKAWNLWAGASWDMDIQHRDFPTTNSLCNNVKNGTIQWHKDMESCTLHNSMFISILEISVVGYSFINFKPSLWWRYSPFTAEKAKVCRLSTLYHVLLQAAWSASQETCLQLCCLHGNAKTSGQVPQDLEAHQCTLPQRCLSWDNSSSGRSCTWPELGPVQSPSCPWPPPSSGAQVFKPGLACSVAGPVQSHLHHRSMIFSVQKLGMMWSTAIPSEQLPHPLDPLWTF